MKFKIFFVALVALSFFSNSVEAQIPELSGADLGEIHGNFDLGAQYYRDDSLIGAPTVPEQVLFNGFLNLNYTKGKFRAGLRYESYQNAMLGYSPEYKGNGIPYRYAGYTVGNFDFTAGNFYEQFGNGFALRTYFEPTLGVDNSIDGFRVKYTNKGVSIKALIGTQRNYFEQSKGIVRGADFQIQLNELVDSMKKQKTKYQFGGSVVSKFQEDNNPDLILPENVMILDGRFKVSRKGVYVFSEYAYKYNDPSADNQYIYRNGQSLEVGAGYSRPGFGINVTAHTLINMSYRSDRDNSSQFVEEYINFVPSLTKPHSYLLMSTLYPYATQLQNEMAFQVDMVFKLKRGSSIGGKYGTTFFVNLSMAHDVDTTNLNDMNSTRLGYSANLFALGDMRLWQDFNFKIVRKFSKKYEMKFTYQNLFYNIDQLQGKPGYDDIFANVFIAEGKYKFTRKNTLRMEAQVLATDQHDGDWAAAVAEFTMSPHWTFSILDQYNYGNKTQEKRIHYFTASVGYTQKASRLMLSYGRQREGLFCVGGICRVVPASNGVKLTLSTTF
ncbi:MAG: DUF6029 family protein [Salibacteraceae bacterium]